VSKAKPEPQDEFLNELRKSNQLVQVTLLGGRELQGTVKAFDNFTVLLQTGGISTLVYKHAIATLGPTRRRGTEGPGQRG
jgi:host factor-I protein